MTTVFHYRPRFIDIRVRKPAPGEATRADDVNALKPGERACDHAGCRTPAATRAPKSRDLLSDHYWFCQPHAAEYNKTWNFFAGMSEGEIRARVADEQSTGGRPTWSLKGGGRNREAAASRGVFRDPLGIFTAARAKDERAAYDRRLGRLERGALADLDLTASADAASIRVRYTELVKRCHPDANGGDRSAEHKLQRVIKAYKTLQKAKLA
ncbi:MAG TPA: J domain-containing protein [Caulobacteraceae bacterium]|nr:J domain-containing protein [Caulobacteraceae bacterium]